MSEKELHDLYNLSRKELKNLFYTYFNYTPTQWSKDFYISRIGYRMQELEFGGLSQATKKLLEQMYEKKEPIKNNNVVTIGTRLIKNYKGKEYEVRVLAQGYELEGKIYKTLSGIAKKITGSKISGNLFFGLAKGKK